MARTIWKYRVPMKELFALELPVGAQVLAVQTQDGAPHVWALVEPAAPRQPRQFALYGTGWELPDHAAHDAAYVGTFQTAGGFVWHLFDRGEGV